MKKLMALFLIITFICMNCATYEKEESINLEPGQKPGAKLVIQKTDGQQIKGELIVVKENSLLLKEHDSGADVTAVVGEIKTIKIVKKSKAGKGALYGFGLGATGGGLYGLLLYEPTPPETTAGIAIFGVIMFGAIGALTGYIVGGFLGMDKTIQIEGKSEAEIKRILDDLRRKARVPNFQ